MNWVAATKMKAFLALTLYVIIDYSEAISSFFSSYQFRSYQVCKQEVSYRAFVVCILSGTAVHNIIALSDALVVQKGILYCHIRKFANDRYKK